MQQDIDDINTITQENRAVVVWEQHQKNKALSPHTNPNRKKQIWSNAFPKLAIEGLTEEQLNRPF